MPHSATAARRYFIRGRVQGVGYRDFAQRAATALGLTGYARNLDDGRVEVFVVGPIEKIAELAGALHKGPRYGEVHGVDEQEAEPETRLAQLVSHLTAPFHVTYHKPSSPQAVFCISLQASIESPHNRSACHRARPPALPR